MNEAESQFGQETEEKEEVTDAGFLARLIARTIDFLVVIALYEILPALGYYAGLAYLLLGDGLYQGRSLGKRLIGLKVIVQDNTSPVRVCGYRESVYRNFPFVIGFILFGLLKGIPFLGWLLSVVIVGAILIFESLLIVGSQDGRRLGDEIAGTRVVENKERGFHDS